METMFGNVPTCVARKRVGPLLTVAFAILVAASANAADLPRRTKPFSNAEFERFLAERGEVPASAQARKQLFDEFLLWRAARERR
jgi:hypothetical protein